MSFVPGRGFDRRTDRQRNARKMGHRQRANVASDLAQLCAYRHSRPPVQPALPPAHRIDRSEGTSRAPVSRPGPHLRTCQTQATQQTRKNTHTRCHGRSLFSDCFLCKPVAAARLCKSPLRLPDLIKTRTGAKHFLCEHSRLAPKPIIVHTSAIRGLHS